MRYNKDTESTARTIEDLDAFKEDKQHFNDNLRFVLALSSTRSLNPDDPAPLPRF